MRIDDSAAGLAFRTCLGLPITLALVLLIPVCGVLLIRAAVRDVEGVRVQFETNYRCENMRGKVYWLHPEVAQSVLMDKQNASKAPCEIDERRWYETAVCETHRLEVRANEGLLGFLLNY